LCNVNSFNGGVSFAVASHKEKTGPIVHFHTGLPQDGDETPVTFDYMQYRVVTVSMSAGDAVLFHPNTFHMSNGNHTRMSRTAWSSTWAAPWTKYSPGKVPTHVKSDASLDGCTLGPFDWDAQSK
jgi:ectoine hydroxylase-related dioxygenase (phytanoyl-CoA dioxygenase family)